MTTTATVEKFSKGFDTLLSTLFQVCNKPEELLAFKTYVMDKLDSSEQMQNAEDLILNSVEKAKTKKQEKLLNNVIADLQKMCNITAEAPGEEYHFPKSGQFKGYNTQNVLHVDSFLYDDEAVEKLVQEGKISRNYCLECGSKKTKELNFISHSLSLEDLQYMYGPHCLKDISGKVVVDVGSRLGAALYYGAIFTKAKKFVGIELNEYFVNLQKSVLQKHHALQSKVEIVQGDVFALSPEIIQQADIVILHNVFEWFCDKKKNEESWHKLRNLLNKKGMKLVTCPSIQQSLEDGEITGLDWKKWVKEIHLKYPTESGEYRHLPSAPQGSGHHHHHHHHGEECHDDHENELEDDNLLHLYEVL